MAERVKLTSYLDLTSLTGQAIQGPVAAWSAGDTERVAGRTPKGDLTVLSWSRSTGQWQVDNVSDEAGATVAGPLTAWVTKSGEFTVEHLAGVRSDGDVMVFWWSPRAGRWQVVNASDEAGASLVGPLTAWVTKSGEFTVEHLAGVRSDGDVMVFWWSPRAGRWQVVNASDEAGASLVGPLTAWVTKSGEFTVEHLAGVRSDGDVMVFWWSPRAGRWQVVNASDEAGASLVGPLTAWVTKSGEFTVEHLAGVRSDGDLMEFRWSPQAGRWQRVNASVMAAGPKILGRPAAFPPDGDVGVVVGRSMDERVVLYWWSPTLEWQACDVSGSAPADLASDPAPWLRATDGRVERAALTTRAGHLVVVTGHGNERRLTDGLQQPFLTMRPRRSSRSKIVTILWDAHRPNVPPRAEKQVIENVIQGAVDSVRGYFLENSHGEYTLDNVATLGWYESDFPASEYWPGGGKIGRDSCAEAIRKAARDFNFAEYDLDRDGSLRTDELFVLVIQPGRGDGGGLGRVVGEDFLSRDEAEGITVDGVLITTIAEVSIGAPPGPGIVAHELSHPLLGLGDMYWPGGHNPMAAGPYSLMDWDGANPHLDPAHKLKLAWLRPRLVFRSGTYVLPAVEGSGAALVLVDSARGTDEYFVLENRWPDSSYDGMLPFAGLGVWHVVENSDAYRLPPSFMSAADWLDPDRSGDEGPVGWSRQGIRMVRPLHELPFRSTLPLWDGADPSLGYDLLSQDSDRAHAEMRWADGTPSGFSITDLAPAGPRMELVINVRGDAAQPAAFGRWLPALDHIRLSKTVRARGGGGA